jgi:hypothetical protein
MKEKKPHKKAEVKKMKRFTTNMALRNCFSTKETDESDQEKEIHSKEIQKKLKLIAKAFR